MTAAAVTAAGTGGARWAVVGRDDGRIVVDLVDGRGTPSRTVLDAADWPAWVTAIERAESPRWVWSDTAREYARLLEHGVRVGSCHDLRLVHAILRDTELIADHQVGPDLAWDGAGGAAGVSTAAETLFEVEQAAHAVPTAIDEVHAEFARQRAALDRADRRLRLLAAAESAGALIAAEMRAAGLPWHVDTHRAILDAELGVRGPDGVPARLAALAAHVRSLLGDPAVSLDSPPKLLRALRRAGVNVQSTSKWEIAEIAHPVIEPLLEYKRLSRLMSANGWAWIDEWITDARFHPVYVPGGVVTGRWASSGGGALQLPRTLRRAVRPDDGWRLVVADVAQLEPRALAAMANDGAMMNAARGRDLYRGLVDAGVVHTRDEAKIAVLGAMYGSTTGEAGRLVPRLRRAYPRAMALVDGAAAIGEAGGRVSTLLGRTSPLPETEWDDVQRRASSVDATEADEQRARRWAKDRGRFTRNFVVQGTAAEWALAWLAEIRRRLYALGEVPAAEAARASGPAFDRRPHLAFFLHDEVILHVPERFADASLRIVTEAAEAATHLLFGQIPLDFPLGAALADDAAK